MAKQYDVLLRLLMIGDSGVGKTCMLCRFTEEGFRTPHITTIGIDFKTKTFLVDDVRVRAQIWDTAGQEKFDTITSQYFRRAQGIMLVYDITKESSFASLEKWYRMIHESVADEVEILLVGNKLDEDDIREVSVEDGLDFAKSHSMTFVEVSAHDGRHIYEAYTMLAEKVLDRQRRLQAQRQVLLNDRKSGNIVHLEDKPKKDNPVCGCS